MTTDAILRNVRTAATVAFGVLWLVAAGAKLANPLTAFEMVVHVVPAPGAAKAALALAIGAETALGAAMVLCAIEGFVASIAGLAATTAVLVVVRLAAGRLTPCGCFGDLLGTTVDGAIVRNAVLIAILAALAWSARRAGTARPTG